jgi:serine/alanine adding enzyme
LNIAIVNALPEAQWGRFVHEHPEGNIFHTPEMFRVFSRTRGYRPTLWAATQDGRVLALLLSVHITLRDGLFRRLTTRSVAYGSVLCAPGGEGKAALGQLLGRYVDEMQGLSLFTELRNLTDLTVLKPILERHGFVHEEHLNYLVGLDGSVESVFGNIGRRTRKNIRRGLKQGVVQVDQVLGWQQVRECYEMVRKSYQEAHVPVADCSLFEAAYDELQAKGMIRFALARIGQTPVAASVELLYKDVVYGWFGGVDRRYGAYVPGELLMWDVLRWSVDRGYRVYDFGGAGKPAEEYGVRDFKAKFGGRLVSFGREVCVHSPRLLRLSELGYRVSRRLIWGSAVDSARQL